MKVIAFYLPQFHNIPENDEWWGDGFTEWTNVKASTPIYEGHKQPKVPLNENYYDLLDDDVKIWQANIAKEYGIYGFCYYHYWFNGKMLLEKPMEQMLANKDIDIPFCICWANEPWTKAWVNDEKVVLIPQKYGDKKEWKEHFDYMLPFFKDSRYIFEDDCPVMIIYRPAVMSCVLEMTRYWNELAIEAGFKGLKLMCVTNDLYVDDTDTYKCFDNIIEWQPHTAKSVKRVSSNPVIAKLKKIRRNTFKNVEKLTGIDFYDWDVFAKRRRKKRQFQNYDDVWNGIINLQPISKRSIPGAFVRWDNSPRFHERATVIKGETPEKFYHYMKKQIIHAKNDYHSDMIFMYAWNEWAEGGYLEPDEEYGYGYLEAIKRALNETGEFPVWLSEH